MAACSRAAFFVVTVVAIVLQSRVDGADDAGRCIWYGVCSKQHYCADNNHGRAANLESFTKQCGFQYSSLCCDAAQITKMAEGLGLVTFG